MSNKTTISTISLCQFDKTLPKNENNFNVFYLDSEDSENSYEEEDILFDYNRYSISTIEKK